MNDYISYEMESLARQQGLNINVMTFKEWNNCFDTDLMNDLALLNHIQKKIINSDFFSLCEKLKEKILFNNHLTDKDILNIKLFHYAFYLQGFKKMEVESFDNILNELFE